MEAQKRNSTSYEHIIESIVLYLEQGGVWRPYQVAFWKKLHRTYKFCSLPHLTATGRSIWSKSGRGDTASLARERLGFADLSVYVQSRAKDLSRTNSCILQAAHEIALVFTGRLCAGMIFSPRTS